MLLPASQVDPLYDFWAKELAPTLRMQIVKIGPILLRKSNESLLARVTLVARRSRGFEHDPALMSSILKVFRREGERLFKCSKSKGG
jgi:hypothetical protein